MKILRVVFMWLFPPSAQFGASLLCLWLPHLWCNLKRISAIHFIRRIFRLLSYFNLLPTCFIGCVFPPRKQLANILSTGNPFACFIVVQFNRIDMDMSYARMVRTASLTSYPVRCKILHQRTVSLS
jgi:hypothetical protein